MPDKEEAYTGTWQFSRIRGWEKPEVDPLTLIPEDTKDMEQDLRNLGFNREHSFGNAWQTSVTVWRQDKRSTRPQFLIIWDFGGQWELILAPELPDLVELLVKLAPIALADIFNEFDDQIEPMRVAAEDSDAWQRVLAKRRRDDRKAIEAAKARKAAATASSGPLPPD